MYKQDIVDLVLQDKNPAPQEGIVSAYAPSNIALCKYWGKRNEELNLPLTPSLSVSLANKGTTTVLKCHDGVQDEIILNDKAVDLQTQFAKRLINYLDLFRYKEQRFFVDTKSNIPIAAGFASSASGYAALVEALNLLFDWQLDSQSLSILARLGSGSACRSLWHGFVEWQSGEREDGMDCVAQSIKSTWPELCVGLLMLSSEEKAMSSREAMRICKKTSCYYELWPKKVVEDLAKVRAAIKNSDFDLLGKTVESNALAMHATMLTADPVVSYWQPETIAAMQQVWILRKESTPVYFTEDAGPNLKLLFEVKDAEQIKQHFPAMEIIMPFETM